VGASANSATRDFNADAWLDRVRVDVASGRLRDMDYDDLAAKARPALITAAMRRSTMTYGELARAIDLDPNVPLSHHIRRVLDVVTLDCNGRKEPSLAVLVANEKSGEPGPGFRAGKVPWHTETRRCFDRWQPA
jgi:hypothetical protein